MTRRIPVNSTVLFQATDAANCSEDLTFEMMQQTVGQAGRFVSVEKSKLECVILGTTDSGAARLLRKQMDRYV